VFLKETRNKCLIAKALPVSFFTLVNNALFYFIENDEYNFVISYLKNDESLSK